MTKSKLTSPHVMAYRSLCAEYLEKQRSLSIREAQKTIEGIPCYLFPTGTH